MMWRADILRCKFVVILSNLYKNTATANQTDATVNISIDHLRSHSTRSQSTVEYRASNQHDQTKPPQRTASESKRRIKQKNPTRPIGNRSTRVLYTDVRTLTRTRSAAKVSRKCPAIVVVVVVLRDLSMQFINGHMYETVRNTHTHTHTDP